MEVVTQPPSPARGNNIEARNICDTYSMIREKEGKKRGEEKKKKKTRKIYTLDILTKITYLIPILSGQI